MEPEPTLETRPPALVDAIVRALIPAANQLVRRIDTLDRTDERE